LVADTNSNVLGADVSSNSIDESLDNMFMGVSGKSMYFLISSQDSVVSAILLSQSGHDLQVDRDYHFTNEVTESISKALEYAVEQSTSKTYNNSIEHGVSLYTGFDLYAEIGATASYSALGQSVGVETRAGFNLSTGLETDIRTIGSWEVSNAESITERSIDERQTSVTSTVGETLGIHQVLEEGYKYAWVQVSNIYLVEELAFEKDGDAWKISAIHYHIITGEEEITFIKTRTTAFNVVKNSTTDCRLTQAQIEHAIEKWSSKLSNDSSTIPPEEKSNLVVFYNDITGSTPAFSIKVHTGDTINLSDYNAEQTGKIFKGWIENPNDISAITSTIVTVTEDKKFYPLFEDDPFVGYEKIYSQTDLSNKIANNPYGKFVLEQDIELTDSWVPIKTFNGIFDGNGKTISKFRYAGSGDSDWDDRVIRFGLFERTEDATIKNLTVSGALVNIEFNSGTCRGGILVGNSYGNTVLSNCIITDSKLNVIGNNGTTASLGGLIGYAEDNTSITSCTVSNTHIEGYSHDTYCGGLTGLLMEYSFLDSTNKSINNVVKAKRAVAGTWWGGGIAYAGGISGGMDTTSYLSDQATVEGYAQNDTYNACSDASAYLGGEENEDKFCPKKF